MSYQKQQFIEALKSIAINNKKWKTLDINHLRDIFIDYYSDEEKVEYLIAHKNSKENKMINQIKQLGIK